MKEVETLVVPASLESLQKIRRFVENISSDNALENSRTYKLKLAVDEIATNIITHGYQESGISGELTVSGEVTENALVITLEDEGPVFDPRNIDLPDEDYLSLPLEKRTVGGLGIFFAVQGVDRFDYRREGDKNLNIFEVHLPNKN